MSGTNGSNGATGSNSSINGNNTNFQRKIGLTSGICFVVGIIIGSGIFVSPKGVFENANCTYVGASVVWVLSGLFSMMGALVYSELGTTIVRSGGDYAYLNAGFGSAVAFLYLWINLAAIRPASQAILALTCAYYLLEPFKSLCDSWDFEAIIRIISALLIVLLGYINCVNVKSAIQLQNTFTVLKVLALVIIIAIGIGFTTIGKLPNAALAAASSPTADDWHSNDCVPNYSLSIYTGLFAFGGWNYLNIVTDELKDPYKNLPRAALIGILFTTVIYVLANMAYFFTLTPTEIVTSPAIALTFASKVIGPLGLLPISLAISASAAGSLNANLFTSSRLFCMGAQEKHLPSVLSMLHFEKCTPVVSIILSVLLTLLWLLVRNIYQIILMFSFAYWLWTGITVASGIYLRHSSPRMDRPIKLPLVVLYTFVILCLLLTLLAVYNDHLSSLFGLLLILLGLPVYWAKSAAKDKVVKVPALIGHINATIQKLFLVVEASSEESDDKR